MGATASSSAKLMEVCATFDNLPQAYRHLSNFPVLAKQARLRIAKDPNEPITAFLREHWDIATRVGDYLTVWDRLSFLKTHK